MGIGAAASEPGTLSILRQLYPEPAQRARALGVWSAVAGLALALGPVIGGLLVDEWSWRAVFWLNAILGVVLLAVVAAVVPESSDPQSGRIDVPGFLLGTAFLACGTFAVIAGENAGYRAWWIVALFAACGLALVGFVVAERHAAAPMLELRYLDRVVNGALFVGFAVYFGVFSIFFFTALYLDEIAGYSGARIAALFAPMAVAIALGSAAGGQWVGMRPAREPMALGCVLAAGGMLLTAHLIMPIPNFTRLAIALFVAGAGFGLAIVPVTAAVLGAVPPERSGMAASATNTTRQLGAVLGVAVLGSLVNAHLTVDLRAKLVALRVPDSFQSIVMKAVEQGSVPAGGTSGAIAQYGDVVTTVLDVAFAAFRSGLVDSLVISAVLILVAAAVSWVSSLGARPPARIVPP
jgi:MFS family permease